MLFDRDLKSRRDYYASFDHIKRVSWEEGFKEGFKQGYKEGREEVENEIAERMINNGFSLKEVAKITGISKRKLKAIQKLPEL